jgi:hypothetical protein
MSLRYWAALALGLVLTASACTQSGQQEGSSDSGGPRLEINKPDVFWADPKVVQSCDDDLGQTTLHWKVEGATSVQVHVGRPDGPLFAQSGPIGSAKTGNWVRDDMIFYLVDPNTDNVLASCTVRVTNAGCPQVEPAEPAPTSEAPSQG